MADCAICKEPIDPHNDIWTHRADGLVHNGIGSCALSKKNREDRKNGKTVVPPTKKNPLFMTLSPPPTVTTHPRPPKPTEAPKREGRVRAFFRRLFSRRKNSR